MSVDIKPALELRKLIYGATTAVTPNLGGHHGIYGFNAAAGSDILRSVDTFVGQLRAGKAAESDVEQVRAQCALARTVDILTDADMIKVDNYLDDIKEQL
jgi:hypothetical protein